MARGLAGLKAANMPWLSKTGIASLADGVEAFGSPIYKKPKSWRSAKVRDQVQRTAGARSPLDQIDAKQLDQVRKELRELPAVAGEPPARPKKR